MRNVNSSVPADTVVTGEDGTDVATGEGAALSPLLLTATEAAAMLKVALRTWRTWHAAGRTPQPIRIGRKTFWRPNDLRAWVAAGCPDRETWAIMRE
jgi:hypothetical protein